MSDERAHTQPEHHDFLERTTGERMAGAAWAIVRHTLFRWSPPPLAGWRRFLLRIFGATIDASAYVAPTVRIHFPWNLEIGAHARIQPGVIINCMGRVTIGPGVYVARYAHLCAGTHEYRRTDMEIKRCPITVGRGARIDPDAFVGPDVTLGEGSLLSARSSAFSDCPAGMVCMGEPAVARYERDGGQKKSH